MGGTRLREIKRRIASTRQIHKVTSALQRVAAARLGRDRRAIGDAQRYTRKLIQLTWRVCAVAKDVNNPLMQRRHPVRHRAMIVFGADRGLCGSYNTDLMNALLRFTAGHTHGALHLLICGVVIDRRARRRGMPVDRCFPQPMTSQRAPMIDEITETVREGFLAGRYDEVHILYSRFAPVLQQVPLVEELLPAQFASEDRTLAEAEFEPAASRVLDTLLPEFLRQSIDHAFLNAVGAENAARQTAMSRASRNAGDMLGELTQRYSHMRQESITTEMLELSGGGTQFSGS